MRYLRCTYCGHLNEVKTEYLTLCSNCNKLLENNYKDWHEHHPDKTFDDYLTEVCEEVVEEPEEPAAEPEPVKIDKKTFLKKHGAFFIVTLVVLGVIGLFGGNYVRHIINTRQEKEIHKSLLKMAANINKACPLMVDSETRFDHVEVLPNRVLQYDYTFVKCNKETADLKKIRGSLLPMITKYVKTNPQMEEMRHSKITFNYDYRDLSHQHLFTISITPKMYQK